MYWTLSPHVIVDLFYRMSQSFLKWVSSLQCLLLLDSYSQRVSGCQYRKANVWSRGTKIFGIVFIVCWWPVWQYWLHLPKSSHWSISSSSAIEIPLRLPVHFRQATSLLPLKIHQTEYNACDPLAHPFLSPHAQKHICYFHSCFLEVKNSACTTMILVICL